MQQSKTKFTYSVSEIGYEDFFNTPEEYQNFVIRILSMQAYAEKLGADEMGFQLRIAPNYLAKKRLAKIVYDEASHAHMLYEILEKIGISEENAIKIAQGNSPYGSSTHSLNGADAVGDTNNSWIDLILNNMLMDRAGGYMVSNFAKSSFRPWAEACEKIYIDEQWHKQFGLSEFDNYIKNCSSENLTDVFSKWFVHAMNFFGPPSVNTQAKLASYGIKRQSNQELRQDFIIDLKKLLDERELAYLINNNINYQYPCKLEIS